MKLKGIDKIIQNATFIYSFKEKCKINWIYLREHQD